MPLGQPDSFVPKRLLQPETSGLQVSEPAQAHSLGHSYGCLRVSLRPGGLAIVHGHGLQPSEAAFTIEYYFAFALGNAMFACVLE